ncbi:beta-carotene 15,15'-monooxygenase [Chryseobacterium foetidum]|uniref:beta-carotene 15,15'-monooxygenase n=1 Tax=Chryseobacterium foetidum TaxID=2951057 RepID=UPI0021C6143E|nr:beta-carotene 15,15'-monooxygenase [Chryseobacterium foetidum]
MPDFDLDSFKSTWQKQPVENKYNDSEILKMLNKKSRNYMKYIFWISAAEFLFFTLFGFYYIIQDKDSNSFMSLLQRLGVEENEELRNHLEKIYLVIKITTLFVTGYFVIKFYQNYKKIKIQEDLKAFITRIIKFKQTVNAFILTNILLFVLFTGAFTGFVFYVINHQQIKLDPSAKNGFIMAIIVSTVLCVLLIWLYYRLVYGIIMGRLDKSLKQLKDIDSQAN